MSTNVTAINRTTTIADITAHVLNATHRLRSTTDLPTLPDDLIADIIPHLFTDRKDRKHPEGKSTRVRSKATRITDRKDRIESNAPVTTANLLRWRQGNGDLHGLFAAQWDAGPLFEAIDTLAQTILILSGARFKAAEAWARTGFIPAP